VIERGQPWERAARGPADVVVRGTDPDLARVVGEHPGARVDFQPGPGSDLARAVGATTGPPSGTHELPLDLLRVERDGEVEWAVNLVVVGTAPDRARWYTADAGVLVKVDGRVVHDARATGIVVANGQYLRGLDVAPRGHPGDGRAEIQVYSATRRERAAVRARLPQGVHLPHPRVVPASGRRVEIGADRKLLPVEIDGRRTLPAARVVVEVLPEAYSLLR